MSEPLYAPMGTVHALEARLSAAESERADAVRRATIAENRLSVWRSDAEKAINDCAAQVSGSRDRTAAAQALRALARRLEIDRELIALIPGRV